ncbi:MAG: hypothetical protein ACE5KI_01630 [Dehalococcoidia bacterium]
MVTAPKEPSKAVPIYGEGYEPDLGWMEKRGEWGIRAEAGKRGLTLEDIQIGSYAEAPEYSYNRSGRSRGSVARSGGYRSGNYSISSKQDIWLRNAAGLYEEALQRQWSSATDIPWETIRPLPDDIERAESQFNTFLSDIEFVAADVPGKWVANTSPDYLEPRMFLMTQIVDEARHLDVFRKRALANGGGLMVRTEDTMVGGVVSIDHARDFSEMSARLHVIGEGPVLTIFRIGEMMAYNEAEKRMYRLAAQDESRHVAFGVMHMRYIGETEPERREEIHCYLDEGEEFLFIGSSTAAAAGATSTESMAILLGGGKDKYDEGLKLLMAINRRQVKEYMQRVKSAGFAERFSNGRAHPELLKMVAD